MSFSPIPYTFLGRPHSGRSWYPSVVLEDVSLTLSREDTELSERSLVEGGNGYFAYSNEDSVNMATIIPPSGIIFNYADVAPAPCKDYCQIMVTTKQVRIPAISCHGLLFGLMRRKRQCAFQMLTLSSLFRLLSPKLLTVDSTSLYCRVGASY